MDTTLVLGGTGKTGRRVADRLTRHGVAVRIGSRTAAVPFEWNDDRTWTRVLEGVTAAYVVYYPDLGFPAAEDLIRRFARVAVGCGVRRLVLLSGRGEEGARRSEDAVKESAGWTVLRASWLAQNFSEHFLLEPVRSGIVALPVGDMQEPFVDAEDVADVAVAALTEPGHESQTYELTGPRLLTFTDCVRIVGDAAGYAVRYQPVTPAEYADAALAAGVPPEEVEGLTALFSEVLDGRNAHTSGDIRRVLGRPARDFADYARSAAATGVWAR